MSRLQISALLIGACFALAPRATLAADAEPDAAPTPNDDEEPAADAKAEATTEAKVEAPKADVNAGAVPIANTSAPLPAPATAAVKDELDPAGYVPGYRKSMGLGLAPWVPQVGGLPGGYTPSFAAPSPTSDWNFNFTGYMSAALRTSWSERKNPASPDQSSTSFHSPPVTADQFGTFTGTNTVPGSWADMTFQYGNRYVTGYVSIATYNPTVASSYYNPGSQYLLNNVYLTVRVPPIDHARLAVTAGAVPNYYGALGQYGVGAYAPHIIGWVPGVGETTNFEYDLSQSLTLQLEQGFRGTIATAPPGLINNNSTGYANQFLPASWVHHEHVGFLLKGEIQVQGALHYFYNWSQDDRNVLRVEQIPGDPNSLRPADDTQTPGIDEGHPKDGHISEIGADLKVLGGRYGYFAMAGAYVKGTNSSQLTGLNTYGGSGVRLFKDWWGQNSGGNGTLAVFGAEYTLSIGTLVRYPQAFWGEGPDLIGMVSFHHAQTTSDDPVFNDRSRNKFATEWTYRFLSWFGVGTRFDRVQPNSKDPEESFSVITPKLYFKSNWTSHEVVTVQYAKWFYGAHTAAQGTDPVTHSFLDDQMLSVSFGMWW